MLLSRIWRMTGGIDPISRPSLQLWRADLGFDFDHRSPNSAAMELEVPITRALLFGVYISAPDFGKLPNELWSKVGKGVI